MRLIIKNVDYRRKIFYCQIGNQKTGFYLTKRLSKIFIEQLKKNVLVDFEISDKTKAIGQKKVYQVMHFNEIIDLKHKRVLYNHLSLKKDMISFLENKKYFLFLDLEMTIPSYKEKNFIPEIIQYGYLLMENNGKIVLEDTAYINTVKQAPISKRTLKFLSIDFDKYDKLAEPYDIFYKKMRDIKNKYQPKIVVWGKNDIIALNHSYNLYKVKAVTNRTDFIDLLKLHKDYFNLKDDLGLFKAYETYYKKEFEQVHDAKDDAVVTKEVFKAFIEYSINELK